MTPKQFNHVFYGLSGSDANDTIVRMVRTYWNLKKKPNKKTIISRVYAYHGSTMASASLGGMNYMHELADLPLPGFVHVRRPYWYARRRRHVAGGIRQGLRQGDRGQDPGTWSRQCRGLHRRADHGRRRRHHSAVDLLAGGAGDLQEVRPAADRRRGHHRLRPHRRLVRLGAFRHRQRRFHDPAPRASPPAICRSRRS